MAGAAGKGIVGVTFTKVVAGVDGFRVELEDTTNTAVDCNWIQVIPTQDNANDVFTVELSAIATNYADSNAATDTDATSSGILGMSGRMSQPTDGVELHLGHLLTTNHIGIWHSGGASKFFLVNYGTEDFEGKKESQTILNARARR